ncbi:uncharacterized protein MYCGRDRAFT_106723, partial [Zymoseptoria tritici IPO323]
MSAPAPSTPLCSSWSDTTPTARDWRSLRDVITTFCSNGDDLMTTASSDVLEHSIAAQHNAQALTTMLAYLI